MLYERVAEIDERVGVDGEVLVALDEEQAQAVLRAVRTSGIDALAIVLMHGWKYPDHEARLADIARELGFAQVSISHEVAPLIKLIGRGDTTVVDAYLSPVLRRYVAQVASELAASSPSPRTRGEGRGEGASQQSEDFEAPTRSEAPPPPPPAAPPPP